MLRKSTAPFLVLFHFLFIMTLSGLLLISCGKPFFTEQKIRELESRLASAGIIADCHGEHAYIYDKRKDRGRQGIKLLTDRHPSQEQAEIIKSVVEQFLIESGVTRDYFIEVFSKQDGLPSITIDLDLKVTQPRPDGNAQNKTAVPATTPELKSHYEESNLSFGYPKDWVYWEKDSFDRIRNLLKSQGADLLVMLKSNDGWKLLQIVKSNNSSSFDSFYEEKKEASKQVTAGMEIMGQRYARYSVTLVNLSNNQKAVLGYAEKANGETGISYQVLSGGYEYDVNFIYKNNKVAEEDETFRQQIVRTLRIK